MFESGTPARTWPQARRSRGRQPLPTFHGLPACRCSAFVDVSGDLMEPMTGRSEVTRLLRRVSDGDEEALDALVPLVYPELRAIARARLRGERSGHTLTTTALVHEAYMKLVEIEALEWRDRAHFFAMSSRIMRRILVDYARRRGAAKRGGDWKRVELAEAENLSAEHAQAIEELDEALTRLEKISPRQSRLLEHRYFGGLKLTECAEVLGVSLSTVKADLRFARAWLARELGASGARPSA